MALNYPNRYRSFAGAAKAAQQLGLGEQARKHHEALAALGSSADTDRPDLVIARQLIK
jgi:hypothetical protein